MGPKIAQYERANQLVKALFETPPAEAHVLLVKLDDVLAQAQHSQEYGGVSDGTIPGAQWQRWQDLKFAWEELLRLSTGQSDPRPLREQKAHSVDSDDDPLPW